VIRSGTGIGIRFEAPAAPVANVWQLMIKAVVTEYTVP
jgi:hypothetical protein